MPSMISSYLEELLLSLDSLVPHAYNFHGLTKLSLEYKLRLEITLHNIINK